MSAIQWGRLDPATIERAIKALLLQLHPGARPIDGSGGDGGRDVRWDSPDGLVIFEIKSFAGERLSKGKRRQIEQSLTQAATHHPIRWVLVLPTRPHPGRGDLVRRPQCRTSRYPARLARRDLAGPAVRAARAPAPPRRRRGL
ncbi:hypothetical protein ACFFX1_10845 [Dactylosporangium sucinum]|uniref:Uncharacterized protein n=1 Tax=Dactylosporangium sucinum TaxID=1424081 RepID=A0A917THL2_9ACTN|nr:hypothetical protein [Dactylosporangium sucinum]GGM22906.1 hypothetical protein GCM10007977_025110 [Dactylosporangium sucinum]